MLLEFSHILAFSALFINSLFDVFSEKGDVPSEFSITAIIGGVILHAAYAFQVGSLTPFYWMIGAGLLFSLYGWMAYWMGMWGGADALAMTVLGFATPYSVQGIGIVYGFSLFINIFLVSTVYAVLFTVYKALKSEKLRQAFLNQVKNNRIIITLFAGVSAAFASLQNTLVAKLGFFSGLIVLMFLYILVKQLEDAEMSKELSLAEVEEGDVIDTEGIEISHSRERNLVGILFNKFDGLSSGRLSNSPLSVIEDRMGYSEIVGVTEEELESLKNKGVEKVKVTEGLRLVPVFPIALVLTEAGLTILTYITFL